MLRLKVHPITAFIVWCLLLVLVAAVEENLESESVRRGGGFLKVLIVLNPFVLIVLVTWDVRRRRRINEAASAPTGLCPSCGYDLRATPKRCPECGTVVGEHPRERDRW